MIDRKKLLSIQGRSRKIQLELARKHGLLENYYACGGCLLTDKNFTNRIRDYLRFNKSLKMNDIHILKVGRHFRYKNTKIIVGRNESENHALINLKKTNDIIIEAKDVPGPITIVQGKFDKSTLKFAAMLTLRYSDLNQLKGELIFGTDYSNLIDEMTIEIENDEILKKYII
ncbi:MAG: hypothetical protein HWN81_14180 [Candidatus Lokiarchaeota archaeon]|nr:hypothetical protein [Candidatus Lokiarchaeota archaeon]